MCLGRNCFQGTTPCAQLANSVPYKFTSRRLDPETELYYYRARMYWGTGGRFLQTDPVGYTADLNLYTYVENDPINLTDPTGEGTAICVTEATGQTTCTYTSDLAKWLNIRSLLRGVGFAARRSSPYAIVACALLCATPTASNDTLFATNAALYASVYQNQKVDDTIKEIENDGTVTDEGDNRTVDVSGSGRDPDADIEKIGKSAGVPVEDKGGGVKVVNFPGGKAVKYPKSKSTKRPTIKIFRPGRVKPTHVRYSESLCLRQFPS